MKVTNEYTKAKRQFLKVNLCARCLKPATDLHHIRGRLGKLLMDQRLWAALCRKCHNWVHDHPAEARTEGLLCEKGLWNTVPKGVDSRTAL